MSAVLANAFSKFTAKSFFSITAASMILFLILNIRIEKVLNEDNGRSMSRLQLVLEFQSPFWVDDSPIHDTDTESFLDADKGSDGNSSERSNNVIQNHNPNSKLPKSSLPDSKPPNSASLLPKGGNSKEGPSNSDNDDKQVSVVKGEPGAPEETRREDFSHLFSTMPHNCVMEQECHIFISDSPQFMKKSMVVIGMVRDSEKDIIATLQQLDEISCLFDQIVFIFYESNSKDNTPYVLEDWNVMYLDVSESEKAVIKGHRPSLVKKILFHDFVDVRGKNRIVRFIIFRNMLLEKIRQVTEELGLPGFDYVMMIDLDIREFDVKSLFRDLNDSPYSILCANGLFKLEIMRDTFASIMTNGTWLYTYHSLYDHHFKDLLYWPYDRYQPMNSCFGGLAVYKDSRKLLDSGCSYSILEDLKSEWEYAQVYKNQTGKDRAWPVENGWFLEEKYREPLIELVTMFYNANLKVGKERRKICEHLAYHYCLRAHDYTLAISRDLIVYYFDFARMASNPI